MQVLRSFLKSSSGIIKYKKLNTWLLNTRLLHSLLVLIEDVTWAMDVAGSWLCSLLSLLRCFMVLWHQPTIFPRHCRTIAGFLLLNTTQHFMHAVCAQCLVNECPILLSPWLNDPHREVLTSNIHSQLRSDWSWRERAQLLSQKIQTQFPALT